MLCLGEDQSQMKKACSDQMKMQKDHAGMTNAPTDSPKGDDKIGTGDTSNK
jgi:hypothetical protein